MFEQKSICPYTGLRSFNEEESLYFEGREKQITEITRILEKNHFLMVTGASGDGKSSVVYAGIIPNARAGFFKARFSNWVVADFRPEKSPLKNFGTSIAKALHITNVDSAETEIKRGFSSLIDLYKNSPHYIDEADPEWIKADEVERKEKINKGANLMILVDQFEEFFTTQENFINGVPSQESQITLNVILETAKIALKDNIPIYIICTMRSDYIGQCAAFRGLPEYIGFSQFFVPRLKRNQLKKVIAEPAKLSGNSISTRLVERLIYDLNEGIDQLPILQHALSQVWKMADKESEEMDLIHYAMVGGMPASELPEEDKDRFLKWYKELPEHERRSYKTASLENVLDIHANRLYESAASEYNKLYPENPISIGDAKQAVALTFACLSLIDEGRGVRNRMTLQEITNIINNPALDYVKVGRLLNILRIEGNTFLRPFISAEENNIDLEPDSVLDITHESLIRNWQRLKKWAGKESEYYETFLDFKKQLDRWIDSEKSSNYLLPVGPLGFFEKWYDECKPNAYWINRYQDHIEDKDERLKYSSTILDQSKSFLKKSAQKHFLPKLFMKYGAGKLATALAIFFTIVLSSFYYTDALKKQNNRVINKVYEIAEQSIYNDQKLLNFTNSKTNFLRSALVHDPDRTIDIISNIKSPRLKVEIPVETYKKLLLSSPKFSGYEKDSLINIIDRNITEIYLNKSLSLGQTLKNVNLSITLLAHNLQFNPSEDILPSIKNQTEILYNILNTILSESPSEEPEMAEMIYKGIQHINNFSTDPQLKLKEFLPLISPFENSGKENFNFYFPKSSFMSNGGDKLSHNGGFHLMAEVYATIGDEDKMYQSLNSLITDNNAFTYTYYLSFNSIYQIFGYLFKNKHDGMLTEFLDYTDKTFNIDNIKFCELFIDRAGYHKHFHLTNFHREYQNTAGKVNPILSYFDPDLMSAFFDFAINMLEESADADSKYFYQALFLKNKALITNKYFSDKNEPVPIQELDQWLEEAFEIFNKVSKTFLEKEVELTYRYFGDGHRKKTFNNNQYFLYPDIFSGYHGNYYLSGYYVDFLKRNPSFQSHYNSSEKLDLFIDWLYHGHEYHYNFNSDRRRNDIKLNLDQLLFTHDFVNNSTFSKEVDLNLLQLLICNQYFIQGNVDMATKYYDGLNMETVKSSALRMEYLNATFFYNQLVKLCSHLAIQGSKEEVEKIIDLIAEEHFKIKTYFIIAKKVHNSELPEHTYYYIEKAYKLIDQADPSKGNFSFQYSDNIVETLSEIGSRELDRLIDEQLKIQYPSGTREKSIGLIRRGKYHQAFETTPKSNTMMEDLRDYEVFLLDTNDNINLPKWKTFKERLERYGILGNDYVRFVNN